MKREESINRAKEEIQRLKREIYNCAHCKSLRAQMINLMGCIPPEPVTVKGQLYEYIGPLKEYPDAQR